MITVTAHQAQPVRPTEVVESAQIHIAGTIADSHPDHVAVFASDAMAIADALWRTLPGGTIDRLVAEMLTRSATRLRIPHRDLP